MLKSKVEETQVTENQKTSGSSWPLKVKLPKWDDKCPFCSSKEKRQLMKGDTYDNKYCLGCGALFGGEKQCPNQVNEFLNVYVDLGKDHK